MPRMSGNSMASPPAVPKRRGAASALLMLFAFSTTACDRGKTQVTQARQPLIVAISADTAGWITPCGCISNQSGGLPRRGSYLAALRSRSAVLYADAGGAAPSGDSEYQKLKFAAILRGEMQMGVAAHNLGASEAALGPAFLRDLQQRMEAPLISANLHDDAGKLVAEPFRVANVAGRRVALAGVLSPRFAAAGMRVDDPRQAVLDLIPRIKSDYDHLIVLAYLPVDELEQLAGSLPEADAIVGGPTGQPIQPRRAGPTLLASATSKGKFMVELTTSSDSWTGRIVEMNDAFPDRPEQRQVVDAYLADLRQRDLPASRTGLTTPLPPNTPPDYRVAGSVSCARCHVSETKVWEASNHARAWQVLVQQKWEVDPLCMQCHTTGYGLPGGFESRALSRERLAVGCEDCHGPSSAHAADPHVPAPFDARERCVTCHDHENSPKFEFAAFWKKIQHGRVR